MYARTHACTHACMGTTCIHMVEFDLRRRGGYWPRQMREANRLTYLPTYLLTYLPTYLPTYLLTYLLTYLPAAEGEVVTVAVPERIARSNRREAVPSRDHVDSHLCTCVHACVYVDHVDSHLWRHQPRCETCICMCVYMHMCIYISLRLMTCGVISQGTPRSPPSITYLRTYVLTD